MLISRKLAIKILKYLNKHTEFYFPFLITCKEYSSEEDDFVEIEPNEWKLIKNDKTYQTFELRENLQHSYKQTTKLLAQWFIEKIIWNTLHKEINLLIKQHKMFYKKSLCENELIEEHWENEFFWWKIEAYNDILELLDEYKI